MNSAAYILVVDDNPANLEICQETLDEAFEVVTARGGAEAIRIASARRPRVVLLDVMMPGIDGYETCRRLRELPDSRGMRIIMVSAKAMAAERALGLDAGANAYLSKPFDESELIAAINSPGAAAPNSLG